MVINQVESSFKSNFFPPKIPIFLHASAISESPSNLTIIVDSIPPVLYCKYGYLL